MVRVLPYPNPSTDGTANLYFEIAGNTSTTGVQKLSGNHDPAQDPNSVVVLRIYTRSGRLLWTHRVQGVKNGANSYYWDGKDLKRAPLANGLYIYTATLERNGAEVTKKASLFIMK
jgi:flagellar hook assembly protein FlgD